MTRNNKISISDFSYQDLLDPYNNYVNNLSKKRSILGDEKINPDKYKDLEINCNANILLFKEIEEEEKKKEE